MLGQKFWRVNSVYSGSVRTYDRIRTVRKNPWSTNYNVVISWDCYFWEFFESIISIQRYLTKNQYLEANLYFFAFHSVYVFYTNGRYCIYESMTSASLSTVFVVQCTIQIIDLTPWMPSILGDCKPINILETLTFDELVDILDSYIYTH